MFPKIGDSLPRTPMNEPLQYLTWLALSSAEKSVTVQTHTKINHNRCINAYWHVWIKTFVCFYSLTVIYYSLVRLSNDNVSFT